MLKKGDLVTIIHNRTGKKWVRELSGKFSTQYGEINLEECVGKEEGVVIKSRSGEKFSVFKSLQSEYILKMRRKAQIIYPKDSAHIVFDAIIPEERNLIFEMGCGSGGLTIPLANFLHENDFLIAVDKRKEFLKRCKKNLDKYVRQKNNVAFLLANAENLPFKDNIFNVLCLDLLNPWDYVSELERISRKGATFFFYLTNVTQILELYKTIKDKNFADLQIFEIMQRGWKISDKIARPKERMVGHTGFVVRVRRYYEV